MLNENNAQNLDISKIELAAKEAMRRARLSSGVENIERDIAKAIAAAIEEYDRQKSE